MNTIIGLLGKYKILIRVIALLLLIIIGHAYNLVAQIDNIKFRRYGIEHGLSQVGANSILQDNKGYIWIGTQDGLNRFDGYTFTIFRHDTEDSTSLSNNWINSIFLDKQKRIWVGTRGGGLNLYHPQTQIFSSFQHDVNNLSSLSNNTVLSIFQDHQNRIWVGTDGGGLNLFDPENKEFIHFQHNTNTPHSLSNNSVRSIFQDQQNRIWIGTDKGLNILDDQSQTFSHFQHDPGNPNSLSNNLVLSIFQDRQNRIWVGTDGGGLNLFAPDSQTFFHFQNDPNKPTSLNNNTVRNIFQDRQNKIWVGTDGGGLNLLDPKTYEFSHYQHDPNNPVSISNNRVLSVFQDKQNRIWVGTWQGGLNFFDPQTQIFSHFQNEPANPTSLSSNSLWNIFQDHQNRIWVGTDDGLNLFDSKTKKFSNFQHNPDKSTSSINNRVWCVFHDKLNRIWLGTDLGLYLFDLITGNFLQYQHDPNNPMSISNNRVLSISQDNQGILMLGTFGGGMNLFEPQTQVFTHFKLDPDNPVSISHNDVYCILQDRQNRIWVGTFGGGLNLFDSQTRTFSNHQHDPNNPVSLSNNNIYSIIQDKQNRIWVGTGGGGINLFNPETTSFKSWREKDGLSNDVIYGILEDGKGDLWLSTNKGINKFNPETEEFTWYDKQDGLQSDEFNAFSFLQGTDGKMYFGGVNGFNIFHPDSIKDNTFIPPVVITDFLLFNESVTISDTTVLNQAPDYIKEITLEHDDFIFAFEFSALNYRQPEKNQFAYKLEGFNEDWIFTDYKDRKASYTSVPHGTYTFRVKASNDDGYWNDEGTSVTVVILPPWWLTIWSKILWVSLFVAIPLSIYRIRVATLNRQKIKLEKEVKNRTSEVNQQKEELTIQTEKLLEANQEISKQKDVYKANHDSIKALSEIGAKIISSLSIDTIIERVYESVKSLLPADMFSIGLYNELNNTLDFTGNMEKGKMNKEYSYQIDSDSERLPVQCFVGQNLILTNNLDKDYPNYPQAIVGELPLSVIVLPLIQKTKVIGILSVGSLARNCYTEYHIDILKNLAVYISIAIENAQTFDKLDKSYAQLQELDEYKEAMTGMIVHDFKNSLNTVISFSEGTPTQRRLKSIRQAGQFMLNMVMNILDVQKFETTDITLAQSNNPISKVIDEAENQLSYMIEQKSIKLKYEPNNELEANYDYELTTRVIVNILSNAIKYVPTNGTIEITIEAENGFIKTSIRDNGPGIPANKLDMVFDKYSQINAKASGSVRSTGIGLTFCKLVVEAQGGTIGVTSEEGKGSNFYFTLPLSEIKKEQKTTDKKVAIELKKEKSLVLTEKEKEVLVPVIIELKKWEVYDYSEVNAILEKLNNGADNIDLWKEKVLAALHNVNEEQYNQLIKTN